MGKRENEIECREKGKGFSPQTASIGAKVSQHGGFGSWRNVRLDGEPVLRGHNALADFVPPYVFSKFYYILF